MSHTPLSINSLHSHQHLSLFQRYLLLQTLAPCLHLHLHISCHFMRLVSLVLDIRLNTLTFKFFITSGTQIFTYGSRLLSKHFCLQPRSLKDSVYLLFAYFSGTAGWSLGRYQRDHFSNLGLQISGKCIFLDFYWNFRVSWRVLKRNWLERYIQLCFMCVCKYLNQGVRGIGK